VNVDHIFAALAGIPRLPGARCVGKSDLFDATDCPELAEAALNLCRGCPALAGCAAWFDSLPRRQRPTGVVAGRVSR
jgi:hypothetical protein